MSRIPFSPAEVLRYYEAQVPKLHKAGKEFRAACPLHGGKRLSLAIDAETGQWFCHSGCAKGGSIIDFEAQLSGTDAKAARAEVLRIIGRASENGTAKGQIVRTYDYVDEAGNLLYQCVRFEPKDFKQRRPDREGGWIWNLKDVRRVPYHLPAVLAAQVVIVCEGEKDAEALTGLGFVATTSPMGAGHWRAEFSEFLRGKDVIVIPDADAAGYKHADDVMKSLQGVAASAKLVELPGAKDASEWIGKGGTLEALIALVEREDSNSGLSGGRNPAGAADEWPKPEPLQGELPPVQQFDPMLLPELLRPLAEDVAERMQVPMDYPAVVLMLCLAGAVSRRATIQPKARDDSWVVVPNLWGGIIAPPGFLKSPVIQSVTRPLTQIQNKWRRDYEEALKLYCREKEEYDLRLAAWKEEYKAASKKKKAMPDRPADPPSEPTLRRLIVNDATFEALHQTMSENPGGVLAIRDELVGWLAQLDKQGREGERAFSLQAWNGDTGFTIDRIGRGTIHVEACCMSMVGGIQPGRLRGYFADALKDGPSDDGLIQRFQLLVWPDLAPDWEYVDRAPDSASQQRAEHVFRELVEMSVENPARYRFSRSAQELFVEWLAHLETKIRSGGLHPALTSHLSKYRSLMPSLAGLFEAAAAAAGNSRTDTVSLPHAKRAAAWCEYLESHARRVYSCIVSPQVKAARDLADRIKHRKVGQDGVFSLREVYLKGWTGLDDPATARAAVEVLMDADWLRRLDTESPDPLGRGRRAERYEINPRVWE